MDVFRWRRLAISWPTGTVGAFSANGHCSHGELAELWRNNSKILVDVNVYLSNGNIEERTIEDTERGFLNYRWVTANIRTSNSLANPFVVTRFRGL